MAFVIIFLLSRILSGLKLGQVRLKLSGSQVIRVKMVIFCQGQAGLPYFIKYLDLIRILYWIT